MADGASCQLRRLSSPLRCGPLPFSCYYTLHFGVVTVLWVSNPGHLLSLPVLRCFATGTKFEHDLHHVLTRATAFEAVMRVRATRYDLPTQSQSHWCQSLMPPLFIVVDYRGIRFSNFYGNYFIRGTDLLALPNCTSDSSFALDMAYDEAVLSAQAITIQVLQARCRCFICYCSQALLTHL